ncbi:Beta-glucosidase 11 [Glycine soja]
MNSIISGHGKQGAWHGTHISDIVQSFTGQSMSFLPFMTFLISTGAVYHKALFSGQHPQHISMKVLQGKVKKDQVYGILSLINTQASQKGLIGITLNSDWYVLVSKEKCYRDAACRGLDFMYMGPLIKGEYSKTMRSMLGNRLPEFSKEEARQLKGSLLQHNITTRKMTYTYSQNLSLEVQNP